MNDSFNIIVWLFNAWSWLKGLIARATNDRVGEQLAQLDRALLEALAAHELNIAVLREAAAEEVRDFHRMAKRHRTRRAIQKKQKQVDTRYKQQRDRLTGNLRIQIHAIAVKKAALGVQFDWVEFQAKHAISHPWISQLDM